MFGIIKRCTIPFSYSKIMFNSNRFTTKAGKRYGDEYEFQKKITGAKGT
ncbi:hypothetical protein GCWU000282_01390 [Catonella morbi ATCC 51271]|uniref:Uncharacterized protein n=1 Tax=Catonella morbi ATCC 51271 TaxID=592026 RepID=V2Z8Y2_9FIRM|nr:hypothetical protein GCWU000282_01390 [Catonella morbi ATCC 51271]